jgi:hypothetical protein
VTTATETLADDDPPPKKPPKFCPWCGAEVAKRWVPSKIRSLHDRIGARVAYVCFACKVGVRAFAFPSRPLSTTKKALARDWRCTMNDPLPDDRDDLMCTNTLSEESRSRVHQTLAIVRQAFEGSTKEELAAFMCSIAAEGGFYDEAIRFAEIAKAHRDAIFRAGGR